MNIFNHIKKTVFIVIAADEFRVGTQGFITIPHYDAMTRLPEHGQVIELVADGTYACRTDTK